MSSKSDPEIQFRMKNAYEESTTVEVGGSRIGQRSKLNFKIGLMKTWPTRFKILE